MDISNQQESFIYRCVSDTLDGLGDGLSHFSGTSRVAVLYAISPESPLLICDPQNLLQGHELKFMTLYPENSDWRHRVEMETVKSGHGNIHPEKDHELCGLISYGGHSDAVFYQRWFTEHHPDMCSSGPTERWLEYAVWRFSHDITKGRELYTGISGNFLREYSTHAVRDHIVDEMNLYLGWDSQVRIYPVLDAILGVSKTREEGLWPQGNLVIIDPQYIEDMNFLLSFQEEEQPQLGNFKHVCKLLRTVEQTNNKLVSDGQAILGVSDDKLPEFSLSAEFCGSHGFLKVNQTQVCSFSDGSFSSTTHQEKLVEFEEVLFESSLSPSARSNIFKIVVSLVHYAQHQEHGCTLVIDLNKKPVRISGQTLSRPIDLCQPDMLELAKSLTRIDGALHIGADQHLYGFAHLLDGRSVHYEDRARGARYNSALRFTAERDNIIVVVVSSDQPVSVIKEGVEISGVCRWRPITTCVFNSELFTSWVKK